MIISGDERAKTVLGYSKSGSINPDKIPDGLRVFLNTYAQEIASLPEDMPIPEIKNNPISVNSIANSVEPLIHSNWKQNEPYNKFCPTDLITNRKCLAGSAPVAIGQILRFHIFPPGKVVNNEIIGYDWFGMIDSLKILDHENVIFPIANLLSDIGNFGNANYGSEFTSMTIENIISVLKHNFCYSASYIKAINYETKNWIIILKSELDNGRPVLYINKINEENPNENVFICDGYNDENKFHFNFGQGSSNDGYFELTSSQSETQFYSVNNSMIIDKQPYCAGENMKMEKIISYYDKVCISDHFPHDGAVEIVNLKNMDKHCTQIDLTSYIENEYKERFQIIFGQYSYQGLIYLPLRTRSQLIDGPLIVNETIPKGEYKLYVGYFLPEYTKKPINGYYWAVKNETSQFNNFYHFKSLTCENNVKNYIDIKITNDTVYF